MALKGWLEVQCPKGCGSMEADVWSFIRGDKDADLRDGLLAGELNLLICDECGGVFYADVPIVYYDPGAETLVFCFPESYKAEQERWRAKMREDYEQMKLALSEEKSLNVEPMVLFGLAPLQEMLRSEDDLSDEVRIAELVCKELGLALRPIPRAYARRHAVPWKLPHEAGKGGSGKGTFTRDSAVKGIEKLLKSNDRLSGYRRLLELIKTSDGTPLAEDSKQKGRS